MIVSRRYLCGGDGENRVLVEKGISHVEVIEHLKRNLAGTDVLYGVGDSKLVSVKRNIEFTVKNELTAEYLRIAYASDNVDSLVVRPVVYKLCGGVTDSSVKGGLLARIGAGRTYCGKTAGGKESGGEGF